MPKRSDRQRRIRDGMPSGNPQRLIQKPQPHMRLILQEVETFVKSVPVLIDPVPEKEIQNRTQQVAVLVDEFRWHSGR